MTIILDASASQVRTIVSTNNYNLSPQRIRQIADEIDNEKGSSCGRIFGYDPNIIDSCSPAGSYVIIEPGK